MLGMNHGTDFTDGSWGYPNGTEAERRQIWKAHITFTQGLLWFWKTDPSVPLAVRNEIGRLGHCSDEYDADSDPPHWPHQLYVREAKRLVGDWVWTEHEPPALLKSRSVGLGSYSFDSHFVSRYCDPISHLVMKEGRVDIHQQQPPLQTTSLKSVLMDKPFIMPYDSMLPKKTDITNLLVPVAVSASHVRFNAVRMEPTWMILGHAAGVAAYMAATSHNTTHNIDVSKLQAILVAQKQMLWP